MSNAEESMTAVATQNKRSSSATQIGTILFDDMDQLDFTGPY
jgi:hypothetical protein